MYEITEVEQFQFLVCEPGSKYKRDLKERTFEFAVQTILMLRSVNTTMENDVVRHQLAKSATSIGANYEEAQAASSKRDFKQKVSIALKEAREAHYWLRIMKRTEIGDSARVSSLTREAYELKSILAAIVNRVSDRI